MLDKEQFAKDPAAYGHFERYVAAIGGRFFDRNLIVAEFRRHLPWAATGAALLGFVSDFLSTLAPIAFWLALGAFLSCLTAIVFGIVKKPLAAACRRCLVYGTIVCVAASAIYGLQCASDAERGFLAENVRSVADLQDKLGLVRLEIGRAHV